MPYLCELLATSLRNRPKCEKMKVVSSSRVALYIIGHKLSLLFLVALLPTVKSLGVFSLQAGNGPTWLTQLFTSDREVYLETYLRGYGRYARGTNTEMNINASAIR